MFDLCIKFSPLGRSNGQKVTVCHNYGHSSHGKLHIYLRARLKQDRI